MQYISTRGKTSETGFSDVLLDGLAKDGGLYVPAEWPIFSPDEIRSFSGKPYAEVAKRVLAPFVGDEIPADAFEKMIDEAYSGFHHRAVAPLVQIGENHWLMELFHGPTLAFKDVAMQLLARLMDHVLAERGQRATIMGATSGDTGSAAIEAFRGRDNTDIFILFPHGRVSPIQQRQMTTVDDANIHCLAVKGDFDDCQELIKAMFNHARFRERLQLSGVNSINWGRIMAQIVYYFTAATSLGAPERQVSFCVPTGNFGDIFAGYAAKRMGLPVGRLIIATNRNDILARTMATGRYEKAATSMTISPSMDIQVSSNFERLLFEVCGRDADIVRDQMDCLKQSGCFGIDENAMTAMRTDFSAASCDEIATSAQIAGLLASTGYLCDPHTAVGIRVGEQFNDGCEPVVTLATAHPAKFRDAVFKASGIYPDLPPRMGDIMEREEHFHVIDNSIAGVEDFMEKHSRVSDKFSGLMTNAK